MNYFNEIIEIVKNHLALEQDVDRKTSFKSLQVDSMDVVEIIMKIEDKFAVEIPDEKVKEFQNLGEIADYVQKIKENRVNKAEN